MNLITLSTSLFVICATLILFKFIIKPSRIFAVFVITTLIGFMSFPYLTQKTAKASSGTTQYLIRPSQGRLIKCFSGGRNQDKILVSRSVDDTAFSKILQQIKNKTITLRKDQINYAFTGKVKNQKPVRERLYNCDVFSKAIQTKYKKAIFNHDCRKDCSKSHNLSTSDQSKNLIKKVAEFIDIADNRSNVTSDDVKKHYEASGVILHTQITLGKSLRDYWIGATSAFTVRCPNNNNHVVLTTRHTFREDDGKRVEGYIKDQKQEILEGDFTFRSGKGFHDIKAAKIFYGPFNKNTFDDYAVIKLHSSQQLPKDTKSYTLALPKKN